MKTKTLMFVTSAAALGVLAGTACDAQDDFSERGSKHDKGCTLTQGYWKNHNSEARGRRNVDWPTNATYPGVDENGEFFGCGQTWLEVLNTPPAGNAFYVLAHQYIAAKLNFFNGARGDGLGGMLWDANAMLSDCQIDTNEFAAAISLSEDLDAFNNGDWGPGHCDDVNGDD